MNEKGKYVFRILGNIGTDLTEEATEPAALRKRSKRVIKFTLIAAAALLGSFLLIVGVAAVTSYDIGFYLKQYFGGEVEMLDEMTAVPQNVRYESTNDEVKFEVVGITGDAYYVYVWIDMTLPEGMVDADSESLLNFDRCSFKDTDFLWFGMWGYSSKYQMLETKKADNVYSFFVCLNTHDRRTLIGRRVHLKIKNVTLEHDFDPGYKILSTGEWSMSFSLNYRDMGRIFEPDISGMMINISPEEKYNDLPDKIKNTLTLEYIARDCKVWLSPISATIIINYESLDGKAAITPRYISIVLDDGTVISDFSGAGSKSKAGKGVISASISFKEPIDPDMVKAVIFGNAIIPLR
jgi:hypothetical protein